MNGVTLNRIGRRADILVSQVREKLPIRLAPVGVLKHDLPACLATAPDTHEPEPLKALRGDCIEVGVAYLIERRGASRTARHVVQPVARVHLVQNGMSRLFHRGALASN